MLCVNLFHHLIAYLNDILYTFARGFMKKSKKHVILTILLIAFSLLLIYSIVNIIIWKMDSNKTNKQINKIVENTKLLTSDEEAIIIERKEEIASNNPYWDYINLSLINVNFKELKKINNDVVAWIKVEGTKVNYPFVQTKDNRYYLKRSFDKSSNSAGWVFLDYRNNIDHLNDNTIIYAHGRLDGTMFGSLRETLNNSWHQDTGNHVIRISSEKENTLWQIFSIYIIKTTDDYLNLKTDEQFLKMIKERSKYNFNTNVDKDDKILTLSTCYDSSRKLVVHAKLIKKEIKK